MVDCVNGRFMIVNISKLKKGIGELYMLHGNLDITMVYLRFHKVSYILKSL